MTSRPQDTTTESPSSSASHKQAMAESNDSSGTTPVTSQPQSPVALRQAPISQALRSALFSVKDRPFVLGLEQDLISFIASGADSFVVGPMNSYYRLLTHQIAEYYGLAHTVNTDADTIAIARKDGEDISPPVPLVSIPIDPQAVQAHALPHPQQPYAYMPPQSGAPPGYGYAPAMEYSMPYGQQRHYNKGYNNRYQNRNYNNRPYQQQQQQQHYQQHPQQQHQPPAQPPQSSGEPEEKPTGTPVPQFKLMKRTDSKDEEKNAEEEQPVEKASEERSETPSTAEAPEPKDPEALETERANRESEYQKARERIFQDGENEIDEDLIEGMDKMILKPSPELPRIPIPQQYPVPYMPPMPLQQTPPMPGVAIPPPPPQMQYYYPQTPTGYIPMMYDANGAPAYPMYYTQPPQNYYRKKHYGYNKYNGNRHHGGGYYNNNRNGDGNGYENGRED